MNCTGSWSAENDKKLVLIKLSFLFFCTEMLPFDAVLNVHQSDVWFVGCIYVVVQIICPWFNVF